MGTNIHKRNPTLDDYWGRENCNEVLVLSRPDIIREIHADFFRVGCDVIETNTFRGSRVALGEFDLRDRTREINLKACATSERSRPTVFHEGEAALCCRIDGSDHEIAVSWSHWLRRDGGSVRRAGIGTHRRWGRYPADRDCAGFVASKDRYHRCTRGHAESRASDCPCRFKSRFRRKRNNAAGTEIGAALTALEPFDIDAIGLNCATGPKEMNDCGPLSGAEFNEGDFGAAQCGPAPERRRPCGLQADARRNWRDYHKHFVQDYGVRIVGGCCGTTPEHLKAVVDAVSGVEPAKRDVKRAGAASSAYTIGPARS